ncbi:MAG: hypothetical protein ACRCXC_06525 [Legionella sp.]
MSKAQKFIDALRQGDYDEACQIVQYVTEEYPKKVGKNWLFPI